MTSINAWTWADHLGVFVGVGGNGAAHYNASSSTCQLYNIDKATDTYCRAQHFFFVWLSLCTLLIFIFIFIFFLFLLFSAVASGNGVVVALNRYNGPLQLFHSVSGIYWRYLHMFDRNPHLHESELSMTQVCAFCSQQTIQGCCRGLVLGCDVCQGYL